MSNSNNAYKSKVKVYHLESNASQCYDFNFVNDAVAGGVLINYELASPVQCKSPPSTINAKHVIS